MERRGEERRYGEKKGRKERDKKRKRKEGKWRERKREGKGKRGREGMGGRKGRRKEGMREKAILLHPPHKVEDSTLVVLAMAYIRRA